MAKSVYCMQWRDKTHAYIEAEKPETTGRCFWHCVRDTSRPLQDDHSRTSGDKTGYIYLFPQPREAAMQHISIRGARTHNLQNIDLDLPRDQLIVITGLSGSGKSSLAFDTIYAEGQRRYVESLSTYARQFLSMMEKPDVDHIEGLSPAISIEQKSTSHNPRSTVGTVTEIYDYLRLLYARAGQPRCPEHGNDLQAQTVSQMVDQVLALRKAPGYYCSHRSFRNAKANTCSYWPTSRHKVL